MLVAGDKEIEAKSVAVRGSSGRGQIGVMSVDEFIEKVLKEIQTKGKESLS